MLVTFFILTIGSLNLSSVSRTLNNLCKIGTKFLGSVRLIPRTSVLGVLLELEIWRKINNVCSNILIMLLRPSRFKERYNNSSVYVLNLYPVIYCLILILGHRNDIIGVKRIRFFRRIGTVRSSNTGLMAGKKYKEKKEKVLAEITTNHYEGINNICKTYMHRGRTTNSKNVVILNTSTAHGDTLTADIKYDTLELATEQHCVRNTLSIIFALIDCGIWERLSRAFDAPTYNFRDALAALQLSDIISAMTHYGFDKMNAVETLGAFMNKLEDTGFNFQVLSVNNSGMSLHNHVTHPENEYFPLTILLFHEDEDVVGHVALLSRFAMYKKIATLPNPISPIEEPFIEAYDPPSLAVNDEFTQSSCLVFSAEAQARTDLLISERAESTKLFLQCVEQKEILTRRHNYSTESLDLRQLISSSLSSIEQIETSHRIRLGNDAYMDLTRIFEQSSYDLQRIEVAFREEIVLGEHANKEFLFDGFNALLTSPGARTDNVGDLLVTTSLTVMFEERSRTKIFSEESASWDFINSHKFYTLCDATYEHIVELEEEERECLSRLAYTEPDPSAPMCSYCGITDPHLTVDDAPVPFTGFKMKAPTIVYEQFPSVRPTSYFCWAGGIEETLGPLEKLVYKAKRTVIDYEYKQLIDKSDKYFKEMIAAEKEKRKQIYSMFNDGLPTLRKHVIMTEITKRREIMTESILEFSQLATQFGDKKYNNNSRRIFEHRHKITAMQENGVAYTPSSHNDHETYDALDFDLPYYDDDTNTRRIVTSSTLPYIEHGQELIHIAPNNRGSAILPKLFLGKHFTFDFWNKRFQIGSVNPFYKPFPSYFLLCGPTDPYTCFNINVNLTGLGLVDSIKDKWMRWNQDRNIEDYDNGHRVLFPLNLEDRCGTKNNYNYSRYIKAAPTIVDGRAYYWSVERTVWIEPPSDAGIEPTLAHVLRPVRCLTQNYMNESSEIHNVDAEMVLLKEIKGPHPAFPNADQDDINYIRVSTFRGSQMTHIGLVARGNHHLQTTNTWHYDDFKIKPISSYVYHQVDNYVKHNCHTLEGASLPNHLTTISKLLTLQTPTRQEYNTFMIYEYVAWQAHFMARGRAFKLMTSTLHYAGKTKPDKYGWVRSRYCDFWHELPFHTKPCHFYFINLLFPHAAAQNILSYFCDECWRVGFCAEHQWNIGLTGTSIGRGSLMTYFWPEHHYPLEMRRPYSSDEPTFRIDPNNVISPLTALQIKDFFGDTYKSIHIYEHPSLVTRIRRLNKVYHRLESSAFAMKGQDMVVKKLVWVTIAIMRINASLYYNGMDCGHEHYFKMVYRMFAKAETLTCGCLAYPNAVTKHRCDEFLHIPQCDHMVISNFSTKPRMKPADRHTRLLPYNCAWSVSWDPDFPDAEGDIAHVYGRCVRVLSPYESICLRRSGQMGCEEGCMNYERPFAGKKGRSRPANKRPSKGVAIHFPGMKPSKGQATHVDECFANPTLTPLNATGSRGGLPRQCINCYGFPRGKFSWNRGLCEECWRLLKKRTCSYYSDLRSTYAQPHAHHYPGIIRMLPLEACMKKKPTRDECVVEGNELGKGTIGFTLPKTMERPVIMPALLAFGFLTRVTIFSRSWHNEKTALLTRTFAKPDYTVLANAFEPLKLLVNWLGMNRKCPYDLHYFCSDTTPGLSLDVISVLERLGLRVGREKGWLNDFPPARVKTVLNELRVYDSQRWKNSFLFFIKNELTVMGCAYNRSFQTPVNPRLICPPPVLHHCVAGPRLKPLTSYLHDLWSWDSPIFYAGGATPEIMNKWLNSISTPCCLQFKKDILVVENDFSKYDSTYSDPALNFVTYVYSCWGLDLHQHPHLLEVFKAWRNPKGRTPCGRFVRAPVMNASGRDDTALMNALLNGLVQFYSFTMELYNSVNIDTVEKAKKTLQIVCLGDDSLTILPRVKEDGTRWSLDAVQNTIATFGFECHDSFIRRTPASMVFLGCRPYPCLSPDGQEVAGWGPTIGRRIVRMGFCRDPDTTGILEWYAGFRGMGPYLMHVPIIREIMTKTMALVPTPKNLVVAPGDIPWYKAQMFTPYLTSNRKYVDDYMMMVYSWSRHDQKGWEEIVNGIKHVPVVISYEPIEHVIAMDT